MWICSKCGWGDTSTHNEALCETRQLLLEVRSQILEWREEILTLREMWKEFVEVIEEELDEGIVWKCVGCERPITRNPGFGMCFTCRSQLKDLRNWAREVVCYLDDRFAPEYQRIRLSMVGKEILGYL